MGIGDALGRAHEQGERVKEQIRRDSFFGSLAEAVESQPKRVWPLALDDLARASGLPYLCPREELMRYYIGLPWADQRSWASQWKMDRGTGIHYAYQNNIFTKRNCLHGLWKCQTCGTPQARPLPFAFENPEMVHGRSLKIPGEKPSRCLECKGRRFKYDEMYVENHDLGFHGHPDGIWFDRRVLWEIKTCGVGTYRYMIQHGPPVAHRAQAGIYLQEVNRMLRDRGMIQLNRIWFLYVPMEDVADVRIPLPKDRPIPFEVDPVTNHVLVPMRAEAVQPHVDEALGRLALYRKTLKEGLERDEFHGGDEHVLPLCDRHHECSKKWKAGQWKWGCEMKDLCFEMEETFDLKKVSWLDGNGEPTQDAPLAVRLVNDVSPVGATVVDPDGLLGEPGATYTVQEGLGDESEYEDPFAEE